MIRKNIFIELQKHLKKPQHTIMIGPRQVGKTTLANQLLGNIRQNGDTGYFLTFEDPAILQAINEHPENIFNFTELPDTVPNGSNTIYLIIDEVQYAENPSNLLKLLYDK